MKNIDYILIFDIINAIGSLATFGAFIFLFLKDRQKQSQIDKLTDIAVNLKRQNELSDQKFKLNIKPKFKIESSISNGTGGETDFELKNYGDYAKLTAFNLKSNDVDICRKGYFPFEMERDTSKSFSLRRKGEKHINNCEYEIDIDFEDAAGNKYRINISGTGNKIEINSQKEI